MALKCYSQKELVIGTRTYNQKVGPRAIFRCFVAVFPLFAACGGQVTDSEPAPVSRSASPAPALSSPAATREEADKTPRIVFLGDSLTAGLGLDVQRSFPSLIQQRLDAGGYDYRVVNAGVSGDTSAGALRRLEWAMAEGDPRVLVVALGGNDGLRGLPPEQLEKNLATIIEKALGRGLRVILAGMEAPPNFGADYTTRFRAVYSTLAERYSLRLIPFLLDGVAGTAALNQADGIHPNEAGAKVVADLVWRTLEPELARTRAASSR